jgi:CheY-like chemotaxis protein
LGHDVLLEQEGDYRSTITLIGARDVIMRHSPWSVAEAKKKEHPGHEHLAFAPGRVLIAEDARCVQRSVAMFLHKLQLEFDMAENGVVACQMAEKSLEENKPYTAILMDMQMPKMNGRDATRRLRQHGWTGPIIAVSVSEEDEGYVEALDAGCNDYIRKPVTQQKLQEVLEEFLASDQPSEPA